MCIRDSTVTVRTDALGITWTGPGRRVFIPWSDIVSFERKGADTTLHYVLEGSRDRIVLWELLSGFEALKAEIAARAISLTAQSAQRT